MQNNVRKSFADRSNGIFSAKDWVCLKCNNINFEFRTHCNICFKGRFEVNTSNRHGRGGGFMEREENEKRKDCVEDEKFDYVSFIFLAKN